MKLNFRKLIQVKARAGVALAFTILIFVKLFLIQESLSFKVRIFFINWFGIFHPSCDLDH